MIFVHLGNDDLNVARVAQRKACGGHGVPQFKVRARIQRCIAHVKTCVPLVDELHVFDNSGVVNGKPMQEVLTIKAGSELNRSINSPTWVSELFGS